MTENLIESIRVAVAEGATADVRATGAAACRTLLTVLETTSGEQLGAPAAPAPASPIAAMATALRGVPPEQLVDLLIAKLRTMVPPDKLPVTRGIHIPLAKVPTP